MNAPAFSDSIEVPIASLLKPLLVSLAIAAVLAVLSIWALGQLPQNARIPIHWNIQGRVDGYAGRPALFLFPALVAGLSLLLFVAPKFEPRRGHLLRSAGAYVWCWLVIVGFLAGVQVLIVATALGHTIAMDRWAIGGAGIVLLITGNFFGKVRSNFIFGVRTPWTLSSDLSWNRTHRLAGWLFALGGVALLWSAVGGLRGVPLMIILFGWVAVTLAATTAYSYIVWRNDRSNMSNTHNRSAQE